ncbi:actin-like isoform X1 [Mya arenaria]|nr:actin-like isoform X1 [Mya arenaria]
MPAFLGRSYFCTECQKGYDHKEKHKCNNVCHSCYKIHESSKDDWIHCAYCNRFFKGQECYTLHKNQTAKGNLTCKTYHRCVHCSKLLTDPCVKENINAVENTVAHVKTVEKEHQCYMKPEEKIEESDEQEEDNKQTYIFFDFECTQEDIVECESGFKIGENGKICSTFDDANNTTAMQRINVGGHDVTETLARTVDARCGTSYSSSLRRLLQMEYLKERVCIYGESTQHTLPDGTAVEVDEEIRNICAMSHYHCQGIKSILYDVISACDHDVRPELLKNVIVSGGASMPLGVVDTITSSLRRSVTSGTGITVVAPPERKKSTWLGGSVLASLSTFPEFCKSRRDYQEHGVSYFDSFCDGEILDKHVDT